MQASQTPALLTMPFAKNGEVNAIPVASRAATGGASYNDGFPPITRVPVGAGGIPPSGKDFNGIFNAITSAIRWANAGGPYSYNSAFANDTNVGGYPAGATLQRADGTGFWINTTDNNKTDPDATDGSTAGWVPGYNYGTTAVSGATGGVFTLTPAQAAKPRIVVTGVLASNQQIIVPNWDMAWEVVNATTGNFSVSVGTASGTSVVIDQGSSARVACDTVNVFQRQESSRTYAGTQNFLNSPLVPTPPAADNSKNAVNSEWVRAYILAALDIDAIVLASVKKTYPVGSVYINASNAANPATFLGFGTWVAFGQGRVLVGFDASNPLFNTPQKTGGAADTVLPLHTHSATSTPSDPGHIHVATSVVNEVPHTHGVPSSPGIGQGASGGNSVQQSGGSSTTTATTTGISVSTSITRSYTGISVATNIGSSGTSSVNANYQPYVTVYMWLRTA